MTRRGDVYAYAAAGRRRHLLIVSVDMLTSAGTAIVVEADDRAAISGLQALLTVPLSTPFEGWHVKAWRVNYMATERLASGDRVGTVDPATLERVTAAVKAAIEP